MPQLKPEIAIFAAGAVLLALGLIGVPFSEVLLIAGSALASMGYGIVILAWRAGPTPTQAPSTPGPETPQAPTGQTPLPGQGGLPSQTAATPQPPTPPEGKSITGKPPKFQLPEPVVENKVPIVLLTGGLVLIIVAVAITFGSAAAFFWGVFIPGVLLIGFGGALLFLRLYRKEGPVVVEVRRFCMHCGFQMSSTDVSCPRCHRQPPSGVDTKVCPNCGAVIPTLAKFCRDCGAGQPAA